MTTSTSNKDDVGDLLRTFYVAFGVTEEGPPSGLNVGALVGTLPQREIKLLRKALRDHDLVREFRRCRTILDNLATHLSNEGLLRELSRLPAASEHQFEALSNGVFWFSLAAAIENRKIGASAAPLDNELVDLPPIIKAKLTVEGSLVLRLYVALVYIREGILRDLITQGARSGGPCCKQVDALLRCDYVRRIRNGLAHGSFSSCCAGIAFPDLRDRNKVLVATPGFLNWLSTCLMLIQLQALSACSRVDEAIAIK
jgi:hypothetical protein